MPSPRRLLSLVALLLAVAPAAVAADEKKEAEPEIQSEAIQFETADTVQLQGTMYKPVFTDKKIVMAKSEADAPVVILLHPFLGDPNAKGWDSLAVLLARRGFHVLRFDFRGHGKSTVVAKQFWDFPENQAGLPAVYRKRPLPTKIELADLKKYPDYYPMLVNDIMAARVAMDKKNDSGALNTATVYLIGAGDAATLGMMHMAAEWTRPQKPTEQDAKYLKVLPPQSVYLTVDPRSSAGKDIAGAIWLSPARPKSVPEAAMKDWVKSFPDMRESNPVLCIYGSDDAAGKRTSDFIKDEMLVAKPGPGSKLNEVKLIQNRAVPKSKLVGAGLLGQGLDTEKWIEEYLTALEKDRKSVAKVVNRNYNDPPYIPPSAFGAK